jgi:hypothetical protein
MPLPREHRHSRRRSRAPADDLSRPSRASDRNAHLRRTSRPRFHSRFQFEQISPDLRSPKLSKDGRLRPTESPRFGSNPGAPIELLLAAESRWLPLKPSNPALMQGFRGLDLNNGRNPPTPRFWGGPHTNRTRVAWTAAHASVAPSLSVTVGNCLRFLATSVLIQACALRSMTRLDVGSHRVSGSHSEDHLRESSSWLWPPQASA